MNESIKPRPKTDAEDGYDALTDDEAEALLRRVFEILEYNQDGEPGNSWDSDTTQALGEEFGAYGITFTSPG